MIWQLNTLLCFVAHEFHYVSKDGAKIFYLPWFPVAAQSGLPFCALFFFSFSPYFLSGSFPLCLQMCSSLISESHIFFIRLITKHYYPLTAKLLETS